MPGYPAQIIPLTRVESARLGVGSIKLVVGFRDGDTNMLVSPLRNGSVGGINQRDGPTRVVSRCSGI